MRPSLSLGIKLLTGKQDRKEACLGLPKPLRIHPQHWPTSFYAIFRTQTCEGRPARCDSWVHTALPCPGNPLGDMASREPYDGSQKAQVRAHQTQPKVLEPGHAALSSPGNHCCISLQCLSHRPGKRKASWIKSLLQGSLPFEWLKGKSTSFWSEKRDNIKKNQSSSTFIRKWYCAFW